MKKLFIIPILFLCISCNYSKDVSIISEYPNGSYYRVRVFPPQCSGALIVYKIPMEGITDKKVDSINKVADEYIKHCEKYTNN